MWNKAKSLLILVIVAGAIFGFFWLANFLGSGEKAQSEKPIVICKPQNAPSEKQECFWTAHIHATIRIFKNGKEIPVKFEEGRLEGQHTHSEPNKLHWHGLIPVDAKTKEVTDWSALEVQKIITSFNFLEGGTLTFAEGREPRFIVNNQKVDPSYIWQDGDSIEIRY